MADVYAVAQYLNELYKADTGKDMRASRLLKMMYYVQRESIILTSRDATLFSKPFKGWSYGPVLPDLFEKLKSGPVHSDVPLSDEAARIVRDAYERYRTFSATTLDRLIHEEFSWHYSRVGLSPDEKSDVDLIADAIRIDALHEEIKRELEVQDHEQ